MFYTVSDPEEQILLAPQSSPFLTSLMWGELSLSPCVPLQFVLCKFIVFKTIFKVASLLQYYWINSISLLHIQLFGLLRYN